MTPLDLRWPHVSANELKCRLCGVMHGQPRPELLDWFEKVRTARGNQPLIITDGCRCAERQEQLVAEGAKAAKLHFPHVTQEDGFFYALDIDSLFDDPRDIAKAAAEILPEGGIGLEAYHGSFVHIDVCHLLNLPWWHAGRRW